MPQPLTTYITDDVLNKIKKNVLSQKKDPEIKFRTQIKQAIREEINPKEIVEPATVFGVTIEDIATYTALSFTYDAIELSKLLNISIDDAMLEIRGLK